MARVVGQAPKARKKEGNALPYSLQRENDHRHLDFRCLASRRMREYIPVVLSHPVGGALSQQPYGTNMYHNAFMKFRKFNTDTVLVPNIQSILKFHKFSQ